MFVKLSTNAKELMFDGKKIGVVKNCQIESVIKVSKNLQM